MFRTRTNLPKPEENKYTTAVLKTRARYGYVVDKATGRKNVKPVGQTNFYNLIQESLDGTRIYDVIDRYNRGETSVIGENVGGYVDCIGLPKSLPDIQQSLINAELLFKSLPREERVKYGQDVGAFLADLQKRQAEARAQASAQKRAKLQNGVEEPKEDK